MKKSRCASLSVFLCLMIILSTVALTPTAVFAADPYFLGSGTAADPFQIRTAADLAQLATLVNAGQATDVWEMPADGTYPYPVFQGAEAGQPNVSIPADAVVFNGHSYKIYDRILNWHAAKSECEILGGHLATITSAEEQSFIVTLLRTDSWSYFWLGATDEVTEGQWLWITGESFLFQNWAAGEPNNDLGNEKYLVIGGNQYGEPLGRWNDAGTWMPSQYGYICEWEFTNNTDTTPPAITAPADRTFEATGNPSTVLTWDEIGTPTVSDDKDPEPVVTHDAPSQLAFALGNTTITYTAADKDGNSSAATQVITIQDTVAPVFSTMPADQSVLATGARTYVDIGTASADDLFGVVSLVNDAPADGLFSPGTTLVTWTATDTNGNSSTAQQKITINFSFAGFEMPIKMNGKVNLVKAGSTVPVKFSLGGDMGLDIFAAGYPKIVTYNPQTGQVIDSTALVFTDKDPLIFDPTTDKYRYTWKTAKGWTGMNKQFIIQLKDGTIITAFFYFQK